MAKYSLALFMLLGLGSKAQQQLTYEITTEWDGGALDGHDPVKITIENDPFDDSLDVTFEADFLLGFDEEKLRDVITEGIL